MSVVAVSAHGSNSRFLFFAEGGPSGLISSLIFFATMVLLLGFRLGLSSSFSLGESTASLAFRLASPFSDSNSSRSDGESRREDAGSLFSKGVLVREGGESSIASSSAPPLSLDLSNPTLHPGANLDSHRGNPFSSFCSSFSCNLSAFFSSSVLSDPRVSDNLDAEKRRYPKGAGLSTVFLGESLVVWEGGEAAVDFGREGDTGLDSDAIVWFCGGGDVSIGETM